MPLNLHGPALTALIQSQPQASDDQGVTRYLPAPPSPGGVGIWPYIAEAAGQGADAASSIYGGSHGEHEMNPLIGSDHPGKQLMMKGISSAAIDGLMALLGNSGNPVAQKVAKILGYGVGAVGGVTAGMNLKKSK